MMFIPRLLWSALPAESLVRRILIILLLLIGCASRSDTMSAGPLTVEWIEVTQGIQDMENLVPLISHKRTLVRVYVSTETSDIVYGWLHIHTSAFDTTIKSIQALIDPSMNASLPNVFGQKRSITHGSLNFVLPPCDGPVGLRLDSVTGKLTPLVTDLGPRSSINVTFNPVPTFKVCLVDLPYIATDGTVLKPRPVDYRLIHSWLSRAFPISTLSVRKVFTDTTRHTDGVGDWALDQVELIQCNDLFLGYAWDTHYCGIIFCNSSNFTPGNTPRSYDSLSPPPVSIAPAGVPFGYYSWDTDSSYGDWQTGHELAHQLGRHHIGIGPFNGLDDPNYPYANGLLSDSAHSYAGFDVANPFLTPELPMGPVRPLVAYDLMSYMINVWPSDYTYRALLTQIRYQGTHNYGASNTTASSTQQQQVIHVAAMIDSVSGTGKILSVHHLGPTAMSAEMGADNPVALCALGSSGQLLQTYYPWYRYEDCPSGDCAHQIHISACIAFVSGTKSIQLKFHDKLLDTWRGQTFAMPSDTSAVITPDGNAVRVRWPGIVNSSSAISYRIEESIDGGRTWRTLALTNHSPAVTLDPAWYHDVKTVSLRVVIDGGISSRRLNSVRVPLKP